MKSIAFVIAAALLASCASDKKPAWLRVAEKGSHKWGYYSGYVEARWENDGRGMTLLRELRYTDRQGVVWLRQREHRSTARRFGARSGRSWADRLKENIGTRRFCTTSPTTNTIGRGRIATACFTTPCAAAASAQSKPRPCITRSTN